MKRLVNYIIKYPLLVLGAFVLLTAALGWQARHFQIDASADTLLTQDNEHYIRTEVMNQRFSPQEFLLIAYKPHNGDLFSQTTFQNLESLSAKLRKIDRVESVRSLLNVPLLSLMEGEMTAGDPAEWTHEKKAFSTDQLQKALRGNPIYEDLLVNESQTATAIQVLFRHHNELQEIRKRIIDIQKNALQRALSSEEEDKIEQLQQQAEPFEKELSKIRNQEIDEIRTIIAEYEADAELYLGGAHVLGYQLIEIIQNDLFLFGAIIAGMICLVLFLLFGGFRWVLVTVLCCAVSVLLTVGLFGMLGLKTTVISSNFIALQLILTLAIVVHLIVQYREYSCSEPDWDQKKLIQQSLLKKIAPCFFAGITTSVGFASLLFTGIQPVISFGWMMIIAMVFSILTSLILFPALLALFRREPGKNQRLVAFWTIKVFNHISQKKAAATLVTCAIAFFISVAGLLRLDVENSFINYFSDSTEVHRELSFIDQELGGSTPFDIIITIPEEERPQGDLIVRAESIQQAQRVQEMLQKLEGMGKILSIVNFTQLAQQINDGRPLTEYELTAAYRIIDEDLRDDLVGSFFSEEHWQLRISARVQDATEGLNRAQLIEDVHQGMEDIGIAPENYTLTNLFVLYQDILQQLFRSQILALGLVYLALTLTFLAIFRSLRLALIGITPNILSTVGVLGLMGWLSIPLDLMTITIASIAMGIAVDDTIHYVHRYREERAKQEPRQALEKTNFSVGYAMLFTSVIIILGFSQLGFSNFMPSVQFGLLASFAMAMAFVWNMSLLPVLLDKFSPGTQSDRKHAVTTPEQQSP